MLDWLKEFKILFKKNIYVYFIILILGILTFGYWYIMPLLMIFEHISFIPLFWFILFLGVLFSLLFLQVNVNLAKRKHDKKLLISFVKLQGKTIIVTSLFISLVHLMILSVVV